MRLDEQLQKTQDLARLAWSYISTLHTEHLKLGELINNTDGLVALKKEVAQLRVQVGEMQRYSPWREDGSWDFGKFSSSASCVHPEWCDSYFNDTEETQKYLQKLQFPADCKTAKLLIVPSEWYSGVGSTIHIKGLHFGISVEEERVYVVADEAQWHFGKACQPSTMNCYFLPTTNCSSQLHAPDWKNAPILKQFGGNPNDRVVRLHDDWMNSANTVKGFSTSNFIPSRFPNKNMLWWYAQTSYFITRPNNRTKEIIERERKKVFPPNGTIPHPLAALYVRHGDKYTESDIYSLDHHMAVLMPALTALNIKHIIIGTEDEAVIKQINTDPRYSQFTFHYVDAPRNNSITATTAANINGGQELMNMSLSNLYLQLEADVFGGARNSNWVRLIDELRKTTGKARYPFFDASPKGLSP